MNYLYCAAIGYLLGSLNLAYFLSKMKKVDIRSNGSGNLGASNTAVLFGWGAGIAVGIHDIAKAAIAVIAARMLFPGETYAGVLAGASCVLGHIFPFYLGFRGGKGLASFVGMTLALDWRVAAGAAILLVAVTLITDFIALGAISIVIVVPLCFALLLSNVPAALIICVASAVMIWKHRENITRIRNHTEIGLRSTAKGENRIK